MMRQFEVPVVFATRSDRLARIQFNGCALIKNSETAQANCRDSL